MDEQQREELKDVRPVEWKDADDATILPMTPEMASSFEQETPQAPPLDMSPVPYLPEAAEVPSGTFEPVSTEDFKGVFADSQPPPTRRESLQAEKLARQDARVDIRNEQKRGRDTRPAALAEIERRAMESGTTTVQPAEFRSDAPSPFEWHGSTGQHRSADFVTDTPSRTPEEVGRLNEAARQSPREDPSQYTNPFETGNQEVTTALREMVKLLTEINTKLPVVAKYSE